MFDTPNADDCLSVMAACEAAGAVLAGVICARNFGLPFDEIRALASTELFYAAQDTARAADLGITIERA